MDTGYEQFQEEMLPPSLQEKSPETQVKKKQSLLSEVLVNGLLKNINEKVHNKLDDDAQCELAGIVSKRVKEGALAAGESGQEKGISFEESPFSDHIQDNANKNRVTLPQNRRLPTSRSQSRIEPPCSEESLDDMDSLEEDFENLLKDEDIDINIEEDILDVPEPVSEDRPSELGPKSIKKHRESYLDDFEALLKESSREKDEECDIEDICDIDADFDALIEKENVIIEETKPKSVGMESSDMAPNNTKDADDVNADDDKILESSNPESESAEIEMEMEKGLPSGVDTQPEAEDSVREHEDIVEPINLNVETINNNISEETDVTENGSSHEPVASPVVTEAPHPDQHADVLVDKVAEEMEENQLKTALSVPGAEFNTKSGPELSVEQQDCGTQQKDVEEEVYFEENNCDSDDNDVVVRPDNQHVQLDNMDDPSTENSLNLQQHIKSEDHITNKNYLTDTEVDTCGGFSSIFHGKKDVDTYKEEENVSIADEAEHHKVEDSSDSDDELNVQINDSGKKVIVPTMDIPNQESLDLEILQDTREAELLIQLKHLNARVEAQDTLLAELKEENTVLKIQNQNLIESLNRVNNRPSLFRKSSKEFQSLEPQDLDESAERKRLFLLEQELEDQKEVNKQLKAYVGDVLINIIVENPDILERKSQQ